ncbi:LysM peptidoglycan-binding domain-containing protein [Listeria sp. W9-0585]|uniref:LysM peptidoglycan-binding domain-containing protein n=1 Tax=Listeria rustica TaxID=2713503 RepID=A0A7W1T448_9LIST|nr:LysM peptidoglycan-binding domain-containing protein [Listeria rustica]MBA3924951.1 LysM peptidoglycan-binding domain-containing protein [Listeria rustica]
MKEGSRVVKKEDENTGREDDQEFKQLGEEYDDDYIDSIPSRSQSRRANKSKKAIFRYPILNLLIIFFLLIPIVCLGVYLFVLNFGSNSEDKVTTENAQTETTKPKEVNIASNEEKIKEAKEKAAADAKAKEEADKKAALEKQQAEEAAAKEEEAQKAAAEKAEQDRIAAAKAEETRKQEEAAAAKQAEEDRLAAEARQKEKDAAEKAANEAASSHTVAAGDTLYKIARQAYGNTNVAANVAKIKQANGITNDNVPIGTVLKIPQ